MVDLQFFKSEYVSLAIISSITQLKRSMCEHKRVDEKIFVNLLASSWVSNLRVGNTAVMVSNSESIMFLQIAGNGWSIVYPSNIEWESRRPPTSRWRFKIANLTTNSFPLLHFFVFSNGQLYILKKKEKESKRKTLAFTQTITFKK